MVTHDNIGVTHTQRRGCITELQVLSIHLVNVVLPASAGPNASAASVNDVDLTTGSDNIVPILLVQLLCLDGVDDVWAPWVFFLPYYHFLLPFWHALACFDRVYMLLGNCT